MKDIATSVLWLMIYHPSSTDHFESPRICLKLGTKNTSNIHDDHVYCYDWWGTNLEYSCWAIGKKNFQSSPPHHTMWHHKVTLPGSRRVDAGFAASKASKQRPTHSRLSSWSLSKVRNLACGARFLWERNDQPKTWPKHGNSPWKAWCSVLDLLSTPDFAKPWFIN